MVHINIAVPDELHRRLKLAAVIEGKTIKDLVTEILGEHGQHQY